jgi:hypothetical protein
MQTGALVDVDLELLNDCAGTDGLCAGGAEGIVATGRELVRVTDTEGVGNVYVAVSGVLLEGSRCDRYTRVVRTGASTTATANQVELECDSGLFCQADGAGVDRCLKPACNDGKDNDSDNVTDFPNDPGCTGPDDLDEGDPCEAAYAAPTLTVTGQTTTGGYDNSATFTMKTTVPGASLQYVLEVNGVPQAPQRYSAPVRLTQSTRVRGQLVVGDRLACAERVENVVIVDTKAPAVVSTLPRNGAMEVNTIANRSNDVMVTYSEQVLAEQADLEIVEAGEDTQLGTADDVLAVAGFGCWEALVADDSVVLKDNACYTGLGLGTYRVRLTGVTDVVGNIAAPAEWSFRVVSDQDFDGIPDMFEAAVAQLRDGGDSDGNGVVDGRDDSDRDGISNESELALGTNPAVTDSDGDGTSDANEDRDRDALSDADELRAGSDVDDPDTDDDGFRDGIEVEMKSSPTLATSYPSGFVAARDQPTVVRFVTASSGDALGTFAARAQPTIVRFVADDSGTHMGTFASRQQPTVVRYSYELGAADVGTFASRQQPTVVRFVVDAAGTGSFVATPPVCVNGSNLDGLQCK